MFDQAKNLMIGLFVIAAVTIIIFILLFIHPMVGDEGKVLRVRFANIDKVNVGTRVNFGGKPVGEVTEIREIIDEPNPRPEHNGYVYVYELKLAVDSSVNVYNSDDVSLRTSGLLGEKSVSITPQGPKKGQELRVINDEIIYADETGTVEDTIKEFKQMSDKIEVALDSIIENLNDITENQMWAKIADSFANIRDITEALNKPDEWADTLKNVSTLSEDMVNSWGSVDEAIADSKAIIANVKDGQGTVGKILMTDDLYLRITSLLNKAQTTMDDVNHYGILFHLDKNWQRLRARRLNLLQKLRTPQEFRNYFNDEVDQISTSLSRVYMVLNKTNQYDTCSNLVKDYEFTKVFSELLRRVEGVEEQLNMYNTQLQDYNVKETELSEYRCP
ncbi:MAG: MlaD family protein [Chlamydiota bacterium]|nr:MlaD family protein [Chlamydiota bacterium]